MRDALPSDRAIVLTGGAEISIKLCKLPFDHILFTGSGAIGREVMKSAAQNLTPVTLELGGKSPAVIHKDYDLKLAALRIARGKLINAGQTCIAPDYALIPRPLLDEFIEHYKNSIKRLYPTIEGNLDYSSIINKRHFDRLNNLLKDAKDKGAKVLAVGSQGKISSGKRKLHPHIVLNISTDMNIAHEEIFGPILSIIPYDEHEEASAYINQRPRPLALYYFDDNKSRVQNFLATTVSGGVVINDTVLQFAQDDLPFGGVGASGMGVCHGFEGFKEFSHAKSIHYQAKLNGGSLIYPPYGKLFDRIAKFLLR